MVSYILFNAGCSVKVFLKLCFGSKVLTAIRCFNARPYIFAVVSCADVALSVFYSIVLRRCQILSAVLCSVLQTWSAHVLYVHYSDTLYNTEERESVYNNMCRAWGCRLL